MLKQTASAMAHVVNLDIVPADFDKFMDAAKVNAVASMNDPGCRDFLIMQAQDDSHHVMFVEVYNNAAALEAHHATDRFKTYVATTRDMVAKQEARQFSSVAMNMN